MIADISRGFGLRPPPSKYSRSRRGLPEENNGRLHSPLPQVPFKCGLNSQDTAG